MESSKLNDFSKGSVKKTVVRLAIPMIVAQLINVLYNIVDRMYVGHMPVNASPALTGLGLAFPIITIITAFTNLCGGGGSPLSSIARGEGNINKAEKILGNAFTMLIFFGIIVTLFCYLFKTPILIAFGASENTLPYASDYITIYLIGTFFSMLGLGMNSFISAQGFSKTSMITISLGAIINIVLDPIFIFVFNMGVKGAALATVISQAASMIWVLKFLSGKKAIVKLKLKNLKPDFSIIRRISSLGLSNFVMSLTACAVQVASNKMLSIFGGDVYIGIMTVTTSVNEVLFKFIHGFCSGFSPVASYNYGAKKYSRVVETVSFSTTVCFVFQICTSIITFLLPKFFMTIFTSDQEIITKGISCFRIYFLFYFMMAFHQVGQITFTSLGMSKKAIFFSMLRKTFIVLPLTIALPYWGIGVTGVFWAEPISYIVAGLATYTTMRLTVLNILKKTPDDGANPFEQNRLEE